ncbi:MAG TPA: IS66 family transposase [Candidatus Limnocylindrales bacterium]|nr:IS66 family transposase [Candidatus Limnocylindrales bacterium]
MTPLPRNLRPTTVAEALEVIEHLLARIGELEERLRQSSQNSSRPPSSDAPAVDRPATRPPSRRRPGGQPGHEGHQRMLLPADQVDTLVPVKPRRCRRCAAPLHGVDATPGRHQVTELPPLQPHVTEYQLHTLACAHCGATTAATLPAGVPRGAFGPQVEATVALCTGVYHLSRRTTVGLLGDLFGVDLALGTVSACEQAVSEAVAAPVAEAHRYVQQQAVVHVDETGWREGRQRAWLWVMVSALVTVFLVHARRNTEAARSLIGACQGILVSDRWSAYKHWPIEQRQLCWAHLLREFMAFTERGGAAAHLGRALLKDADTMFARWHRVRDGTLSRPRFWREMRPLRHRVERRLRRGATGAAGKTAATCRDLVTLAPALWTFIDVPGVEPTNNAAERALRPAVLWRKGCFGTHSAAGSRFAERMLTVATTLRQQGRNVVDYVAQASVASLQGQPPPSLLPVAARAQSRRLATV